MSDVKPDVSAPPPSTDAPATDAGNDVEMKPEVSQADAPTATAGAAESSSAAVKKEAGVKAEPKEIKVAVFDEPLPKVEGKTEDQVHKLLSDAAKQSELP